MPFVTSLVVSPLILRYLTQMYVCGLTRYMYFHLRGDVVINISCIATVVNWELVSSIAMCSVNKARYRYKLDPRRLFQLG